MFCICKYYVEREKVSGTSGQIKKKAAENVLDNHYMYVI